MILTLSHIAPPAISVSATDPPAIIITDRAPLSVSTASANTWTAPQRSAIVALTDATTIAVNFSLGNNFSVTLAGSRTLDNPSNIVAGQSGQIVITQDGTGSRTLAYGSYWKFSGGTAPVLTTTAGGIDIISYFAIDSGHIAATALLGLA